MTARHVHLIGIGGTGMAALAGLLHESGLRVSGSDYRLYPPTSVLLERLGLDVREGFDPTNLDPAPDLVVVGNAISRGNPEVEELLDRRYPFTSMPALLAERFIRGRHSIVVAGTHGKTTTASMMAWVLEQAGRSPGFLIGGMPRNFGRPYSTGRGDVFVIEGDEYDTAFFDKGPKFMHYRPDTAIIGAVEFDHADIFEDLASIERVFARFVNLVPRRGLVIRNEDCAVTRAVTRKAFSRVEGCGFGAGRWTCDSVSHGSGRSAFRVLRDGEPFAEIEMDLAGEHNVRNAMSVVAAASDLGLSAAEIARGLGSFEGVARRLEVRGEENGIVVLDDFAHHPTAVSATLAAVRDRWPGRRVWAVLEPRSWSMRRNVFQQRLAQSFDAADETIVADVFQPEAVPQGERLDPETLVRDVRDRGGSARHLPGAVEIVDLLAHEGRPGDVVVIMSNGGFDGLHTRLLSALAARAGAA